MPRTRTIPDEVILDAALQLMGNEGPTALTFAAVGARVGLAPATLVQRFGTKDALQRAALTRAWDMLDAATEAADATQTEDLDGAIAVILALFPEPDAAVDVVDGLLLLREDLRDPVLRARGVAWLNTLALALGRRITTDPQQRRRLGRMMVSQWQGAQIWWAFHHPGNARDKIVDELRDWHQSLRL
jgi:AcrR family transcriptional regulator